MNDDIEKILKTPKESLNIEFKREWYWDKDEESKGKLNWDEFLKDFTALCNTLNDTKYLIIGINDSGDDFFNYFEDNKNNKLDFFNRDLDEIRNEIIKKILNSFECYYFDNDSLDNEKDIFLKNIIFSTLDVDDKQILVIKINQFPFLLRLQKDRNLKKYREKSILIRTINNDGPGCTVMDEEHKEKYKTNFDSFYQRFKMLSSKNTIQYLLEANAKFLYNRYTIKQEHEHTISYSNSNFFEIYSINQNQKHYGLFIYFSKYSSIQKVLENEILNKYLMILKKYQNIYIIFEEQRDFKRIVSKIDTIKVKNNSIFIGNNEIEYFDSSTMFIEKTIYEQIKNEIENEVLFSKAFSGVFVNPLVNDNNLDIISIMKTWINTKHSPMFALIGEGGVGKTTIAKKFCSQIENDIIFIDSKELISNLKYIEKLNTLHDFVKLFIQSQDTEIDENYFNEELINILVDSGKLLIVIDGLDEVMLNYSDFNLNAFIETIYNNCLDNLGKTKILLTIRDTFWENDYKNKIESFLINGFDINKSKEYFLKKLKDDKLSNKAIRLLQLNLPDEKIFSPFILEIIILTIKNKIDKDKIISTFICKNIFIDILIYHICTREAKKFPNIHDKKKIDEQIEFFIKIAIEYNGEITLKQLSNIVDGNTLDAYKAHMLLSFNADKLSFKFDILIEYFKMLNLIKIVNQNIHNYDEKLLTEKNNQLFKQIYLDNKNLIRIVSDNIDKIKFLYFQILDRIDSLHKLEENLYIYSFILSIILRLNNKQDKQSNTELIKELLSQGDMFVGLCLFNNHYLYDKFLFNFNDMKFKYSYVNYKYFGDSEFNNTKFYNCNIQGYFDVKYNFSENNFDTSSILSENMKKILEVKEEDTLNINKKIKDKILDIFKKFYKNAFKKVRKERLKIIDNDLLKFLIKEGIVEIQHITTPQKRREEVFSINSEYQDDIEMILSNQVEDLKIINELIENYNNLSL